ncbi:MAG: hypothetical protein AAF806_03505 [Bacteroidota bacterium]
MRPQDIVILLKIAAKGKQEWQMKTLANELVISASEVSESLKRSVYAGLIMPNKKTLLKGNLLDFLRFGLKYVFPQRPSAIVKGLPTAHSATPLRSEIISEDIYVWPYSKGEVKGQSIEPLYPTVPQACENDEKLYELLTLTDALRVGRVREQNLAFENLKKLL